MALIVEDGTGIADANSYDTVANAQAYFDLKGTSIIMTEEALINATQYLDLRFGLLYNGTKVDADQSLSYPRTSFVNKEGFIMPASTIHSNLKRAMYESAKLYIDQVNLFDDTNTGEEGLKSITNSVEGAVSQSKEWFAPLNINQKSNIGKYLSNILTISVGHTVRVK